MDWSDEIRLSRFTDDEAGMLAKIRLTFKNMFVGTVRDAEDVFGAGWKTRADALRRYNAIAVSIASGRVIMTVVAPGDRKRANVREAMRRHRQKKGGNS